MLVDHRGEMHDDEHESESHHDPMPANGTLKTHAQQLHPHGVASDRKEGHVQRKLQCSQVTERNMRIEV